MLVLFSGGCDSTLLLHNLAKNSSSIWPIKALSVNHCRVSAYKYQAKARKRIIAELRDRGYHIQHTEIKIEMPIAEFETIKGDGFAQPLLWLCAAIPYLDKEEDLHIGYVHGDQMIHHKADLLAAFNSLQLISSKTGKLILDLEWESKAKIIKALREAKLLDLVWYCENNNNIKGKPCMHCQSCVTHHVALYEADQFPLVQKAYRAKINPPLEGIGMHLEEFGSKSVSK